MPTVAHHVTREESASVGVHGIHRHVHPADDEQAFEHLRERLTLAHNAVGTVGDTLSMTTSRNRVLTVIGAVAVCTILAATLGLGRLLWDELRGLGSPQWLFEWSAKGLAGGLAADMVARNWRKHPAAGLATLATASIMYCVCRRLWLEAVAAAGDPFGGASLGGVITLFSVWFGWAWLVETVAPRRRHSSPAGIE